MSEHSEFAKIFNVDGRQVLVYLEEGDDRDYELHQITRASFGLAHSKSSFSVSDDAPDDFDAFDLVISKYTEEKARAFVDEIQEFEASFSSHDATPNQAEAGKP